MKRSLSTVDLGNPLQRLAAPLLFCALVLLSMPGLAQRQAEVRGLVTGREGEPLDDAIVEIGTTETATDEKGRFLLLPPPGEHLLLIRHPGYIAYSSRLTVGTEELEIEISLTPVAVVSETISVDAVRARKEAPVTRREMGAAEIAALSHGQDIPALLETTPSITWYSDSGTGSNYSYFSLRGISQSRINVTLDGAPLNDPAEHALYFNNFHDLASAIDSIQVQRGVGTSTVGSPAFGGSVNFASAEPAGERKTDLRLGFGSYDARRASASFHSGLLDGGLALSGRVSYARSDNYRERSGTEHDTVFFNASWVGKKSSFKLVSFSGRERSQLAFLAVEPEVLERNPRFNPLAEEERDRFGQDFAQLQYVRPLGVKAVLVGSVYYNGADGWFRLWDDPVARRALLEFGIDQRAIGSMINVSRSGAHFWTKAGMHFSDFRGDHTLDSEGSRAYRNTGVKRQANAFVKAGHDLGRWHFFGDLHLRWARFEYLGDLDLEPVDWTFFDPKVGFRYSFSDDLSLYASIGRAQREPSRLDLLAGEDNATVVHDLRAVRPETVMDLEVGLELERSDLVLAATLYAMEFEDEIAATGELSDVGLPLRVNVDESYRRGLELDARWRFSRQWALNGSATLSRNRIREWIQYYDVYDAEGSWIGSEPRIHRDVEPLLTPDAIFNLGLDWKGEWLGRFLEAALSGRRIGSSALDNSGNSRFSAPSHTTIDLRAVLGLSSGETGEASAGPRLSLHLRNLLDETDRYAGGYSYLFLSRDGSGNDLLDGIPYYYPLAGRNVSVTLDFSL